MNRRLISPTIGGTLGLAALITMPLLSPGPAWAQATVQPSPNPAESQKTIPEKIAPPEQGIPPAIPESGTTATRPGETLSEKLDRSEGVIQPREGIDPNMAVPAPTPNPGTTPVIPPPGSPGNPSDVRPK